MNPSDLGDALASLDFIDPIEGVISSFVHADWKGAVKRHGLIGIAREFVSAATAHNSPVIAFRRGAGWSGIEVERLLARHGVVLYGRGFSGNKLFFQVERRQARWATYLLKRAGVPVVDGHWSPRDATWQAQPRSSEPPIPARYRKR